MLTTSSSLSALKEIWRVPRASFTFALTDLPEEKVRVRSAPLTAYVPVVVRLPTVMEKELSELKVRTTLPGLMPALVRAFDIFSWIFDDATLPPMLEMTLSLSKFTQGCVYDHVPTRLSCFTAVVPRSVPRTLLTALPVLDEPVMLPRMPARLEVAEVLEVVEALELTVVLCVVAVFVVSAPAPRTLLRMFDSWAFAAVGIAVATMRANSIRRMFFFIVFLLLLER